MSQVISRPRTLRYPTALIVVAGGLVLTLLAAVVQGVNFGVENISLLSLAAPFLIGCGGSYFALTLLRRNLENLRGRLENEFAVRTRDLETAEKRFSQYAENSTEWFWETDADNRFVFLSSH